MAKELRTEILHGSPYFIHEIEREIFKVVKKISEKDTGWKYELDEEIGELHLGIDIREVSNRDVGLVVRSPNHGFFAAYAIEKLKNFASVASYDYIAIEKIGPHFNDFIAQNGTIEINEIRPRPFIKLNNN